MIKLVITKPGAYNYILTKEQGIHGMVAQVRLLLLCLQKLSVFYKHLHVLFL